MILSPINTKNVGVLSTLTDLTIQKMIVFLTRTSAHLHSHSATATIASTPTQPNANPNANSALASFCTQDRPKEALHILYSINNNMNNNNNDETDTYVSALQVCMRRKAEALPYAKLIHARIHLTGFRAETVVENTLLTTYTKCGSLADARAVFDHMRRRDVCSWTAIVSAYSRSGLPREALQLFDEMRDSGVRPNHYTFASVLSACAALGSLEEGIRIHREIKRSGFEGDRFVGNALVDMYAKCGSLENARQVFDKMPQRDAVSWTALVAGYAQRGRMDEALELFEEMPRRDAWSWTVMIAGFARNGLSEEALAFFWQMQGAGLKPNQFTFAAVLPACYDLCSGVGIHKKVIRSGFQSNVLVTNALIDMYAKCGSMKFARELFDKMPEPDLISWTSIIAGCAHNGLAEVALELFKQMRKSGVKPDGKTFASILPACANLGALERGIEIHEEIRRSGFQCDMFVVSALIDMYAKCGSLEKARELFEELCPQDVVSWTAMIAGYAMHGRGKEAIKLFEEMRCCGISPNGVTLICVLSACCHAGLVEEGRHYYSCMREHHHITPTMDHYSCMVDLLGRAGHLDEAQDFINKMPTKPDASVWNSLLSGCRLHENIELGEHAARQILELEPQSAALYVLLSKLYVTTGRWNDIENLRNMMKHKEATKTVGCSWIEVNRQVHPFVTEDM